MLRILSNLNKTPDESALTAKKTAEVNVKPKENKLDLNQLELEPPKTCYEFRSNWKLVKNSPQHAWNYIRVMKSVHSIFKNGTQGSLPCYYLGYSRETPNYPCKAYRWRKVTT